MKKTKNLESLESMEYDVQVIYHLGYLSQYQLLISDFCTSITSLANLTRIKFIAEYQLIDQQAKEFAVAMNSEFPNHEFEKVSQAEINLFVLLEAFYLNCLDNQISIEEICEEIQEGILLETLVNFKVGIIKNN